MKMEQSLLIEDLEIHYANVDELKPHPKNSHKHSDDQIERLCKIVEYNKFRTPLTLDKKTGTIVCGHGRLMAAKKLGMKKVPVVYQDFESEDHIYAHLVADNAIGKDTWATLDLGMINQEVINMGPDFDIDVLGLKDFVIEPVEKYDEEKEDDVPEVKHDPITKRGDVWLLGEHRVMCGDSTMIDDVEKLMNGEKADLLLTDPPYNLAGNVTILAKSHSKGSELLKAAEWDIDFKINDFLQNLHGFLKKDSSYYIFTSNILMRDIFDYLESFGDFTNYCIYEKTNPTPYAVKRCWVFNTELIAYGHKGKYVFNYPKSGESLPLSCLKFAKTHVSEFVGHPTQKPIKLMQFIIEKSSIDTSIIAEPFLGSGSTLIACEKTKRKCYGMELDEHYCDVIINRWQEYTGKEAVLESTKESYNELRSRKE
jgi:DNA modification methylase